MFIYIVFRDTDLCPNHNKLLFEPNKYEKVKKLFIMTN